MHVIQDHLTSITPVPNNGYKQESLEYNKIRNSFREGIAFVYLLSWESVLDSCRTKHETSSDYRRVYVIYSNNYNNYSNNYNKKNNNDGNINITTYLYHNHLQ